MKTKLDSKTVIDVTPEEWGFIRQLLQSFIDNRHQMYQVMFGEAFTASQVTAKYRYLRDAKLRAEVLLAKTK